MVSKEEKNSKLYSRIITILYSTMPPADKLRAILNLCMEDADEDDKTNSEK